MSFSASTFFNLDSFGFGDLFNSQEDVWITLKKLNEYIDHQLSQAKFEKTKIDPSTIVQDTARIEGKVLIGKNCIIGHGVLLRDGVILGDNVAIGHGVELKHSVILNNTAVAHLNYVGDSIIGSGVNISGGAILANWRFDKKSIKIKGDDGIIDTGLEKFGAIIGDGSTIGVNAVLNPGTILGKGTLVYPLTSVKGIHAENSIIKER